MLLFSRDKREYLGAWNDSQSKVLATHLECAYSLVSRFRGLLGRSTLGEDSGMLFVSSAYLPVMWLHTVAMRFTIDVLFLDRFCRVLKMNCELPPWRLSSLVFGASFALELPAGTVSRSETRVGDHILLGNRMSASHLSK